MVVSCDKNELIHHVRLSSVGPGRATGTDVVFEPSGLDLATKLHYLRGVYFFDKEAAQGLTTMAIKEAMFTWFNDYYHTCGRFRRNDAGRPYIKCNDCGARFVEGQCDRTVEEWLQMQTEDPSLHDVLVYQQVIGPEIQFSPPLFFQVTRFKCGGLSLGLNWAHVLGDAFSASHFINMWGRTLATLNSNALPKPLKPTPPNTSRTPVPYDREPLSVKRVNPVGDLWITANDLKMETFSFHVTASQLTQVQEKVSRRAHQVPPFEALCATIWQCIAKAKGENQPKIVTICKNDPHTRKAGTLGNHLFIGTVRAEFDVADADPEELAMLMVDQVADEKTAIEEEVNREHGVSDMVLYGANLSFVDLEGAELYSLEVNEHKPVFVNYSIGGVGDKGAVMVVPGPEMGRVVNVTLPENDMLELKSELKRNGLLLA